MMQVIRKLVTDRLMWAPYFVAPLNASLAAPLFTSLYTNAL